MKKSDFRSARSWIDTLPAESRLKAEDGAAAMVAAVHLAELRKALKVTQTTVAERSGMKQPEISRIEAAPEAVRLRTLERYVTSLGGTVKLVAEFPDGTKAEIPLRSGRPVRSRIAASSR